jgi:hypothetical protein
MKRALTLLAAITAAALLGCPPATVVPDAPLKVAPFTALDCESGALITTEASAPTDFALGADADAVAVAWADAVVGVRVDVATMDGLGLGTLRYAGAPWRPVAATIDADRVFVAVRSPSRHRTALLVGRVGDDELHVAWEAGDETAPDAQREIALARDATGTVVALERATSDDTLQVRSVDGEELARIELPAGSAVVIPSPSAGVVAVGSPAPTAMLVGLRANDATGVYSEFARIAIPRVSGLGAAFSDVLRPTLAWMSSDGEQMVLNALSEGVRRHAVLDAATAFAAPRLVGATALLGGSLLVVDAAEPRRLGAFWLDDANVLQSATTWLEWAPGVAEAAAADAPDAALVVFADYHGAMATGVVVARLTCAPSISPEPP